jgi:hypothetical protein
VGPGKRLEHELVAQLRQLLRIDVGSAVDDPCAVIGLASRWPKLDATLLRNLAQVVTSSTCFEAGAAGQRHRGD